MSLEARISPSAEPKLSHDVERSTRVGEVRARVEKTLGEAKLAFDAADLASDRLGNVRLALALLGLAMLLAPLVTRDGTPWWGLIPLAVVFIGLGKWHDTLVERRRVAAAGLAYVEGCKARLDERWRKLPDDGADLAQRFGRDGLAGDLDLFGPASLFQLLSRAVTSEGRRILARWMVEPAPASEIRARQAAVSALAKNFDLRRSCYAAAASDEAGQSLADEALLGWAKGGAPIPARGLLSVLGVVQPALLAAAAVWTWGFDGPSGPLYALAAGQLVTAFVTRGITAPRAALISGPERVLARYARLIEIAEALPANEAERLDELRATLASSGKPASEELRGLERLVEMLDARLNMFFALTLGPALLWEMNVVLRAEKWRERVGPRLEGWLRVLGELEALASLGAFADERPDYAMPEIADTPAVFQAEGLAHPLIDRRRVVSNDLDLGGAGGVLLLSGSNMSGKSTLLRAVGLAVVLAGAGAPAPARRLRLSSFRLASSVRVVDSLAEGASHFYAELQRLKRVVELATAPGPTLLYLLDEILHGTNSRERVIGAVSVVRWLAQAGATGIVTTHDLELAKVAEHLPSGAVRNAHFSDDVAGSELRFDYHLREGPIRTTNALRLMRAVGIDVELLDV